MSLYVEVVAQEDISGRVVICLLTNFQRIYQYPLRMSGRILIETYCPLKLIRIIANGFPRVNNTSFVCPKLATVYEVCHIRYKCVGGNNESCHICRLQCVK